MLNSAEHPTFKVSADIQKPSTGRSGPKQATDVRLARRPGLMRACSLSPASELSTRCTPRPPVPRSTAASNAQERLSAMCPGDRAGKRARRVRRFASVLQVVYTWCACKRFQPKHLCHMLLKEVEDEACPFSTAGQLPSTLMVAWGGFVLPLKRSLSAARPSNALPARPCSSHTLQLPLNP